MVLQGRGYRFDQRGGGVLIFTLQSISGDRISGEAEIIVRAGKLLKNVHSCVDL